MDTHIEELKRKIEDDRNRLLEHPVYHRIKDLKGLQEFTQVHVFAVWDFMSLLKSLQNTLTNVTVPWYPVGSAGTRYLINEIVLGEESDLDEEGKRISHFELYLKAMHQMGADTSAIDSFTKQSMNEGNILELIASGTLHKNIKAFLTFTFETALYAPAHVKAAVFTFGREDLIPAMFLKVLGQLYAETPDKVSVFKYYIERHIELDGEHHSHLAMNMVSELCGADSSHWEAAISAARKALQMRYLLWDAVICQPGEN